MYVIDMNSKLELTALMIPRPGTSPIPLVRTCPYLLDGRFWHRLFPALSASRPVSVAPRPRRLPGVLGGDTRS